MTTDFDASAVFDHVLARLSIATCGHAGIFMFNLLHNMKFHLIMGFGQSPSFYLNDNDGIMEQGIIQGSSSAAPIFHLNSNVSLSAYKQLGTGATFTNPITQSEVLEHAVQFVDDISHYINNISHYINKGSATNSNIDADSISDTLLIQHDNKNSQIRVDLLWISGGNLNLNKCYYYAFLHISTSKQI